MSPVRLNKREKAFVTVAIAAVFIYIYYNYFLYPQLEKYMALKDITSNKSIQLDELRETLKKSDLVIRDIEESKGKIASLEKVVPSNKKLPEVIVQLEQMALLSGVQIREMTFQNQDGNSGKEKDSNKVRDDYLEIPIGLKVTGKYKGIISFLRQVEGSKRLLKVENIFITRNTQNSGELVADIGIKTFVLKHSGAILEDPGDFPFMGDEYGKDDPFAPLSLNEAKDSRMTIPSYEEPPADKEIIDMFIEEFLKKLLD